jgi:integrase
MQLVDDRLLLSASDLINYLECAHLTRLDLEVVRGEIELDETRIGVGVALAQVMPSSHSRTRAGRATKSILNDLGLLHSIFAYGEKRGWCVGNPCKLVDKPRNANADAEIRFLDEAELEALLGEVPDDELGRVERVLYLTAAMTGLRQGELLALRWHDVDWMASRLRVRRNFVRGEFGTPKSRRSSRSVPLADRVSVELDLLHRETHYGGDDDLVFGHPHLGKPVDRSKLLKRFKRAAGRAGLREVRFHDLRHTFGTRIAAAGVPMRALQEWMGHRDFKTTLIYADYAPSTQERELVERAFGSRGGAGAAWPRLDSQQQMPSRAG